MYNLGLKPDVKPILLVHYVWGARWPLLHAAAGVVSDTVVLSNETS